MGRLSVLLNSELPSRAVAVYLVLNEYADKNGYCFPSLKTIAQGTGLSKSTVKRAIQDLTAAGFIQREQRYRENGALSSCMYHLLFR